MLIFGESGSYEVDYCLTPNLRLLDSTELLGELVKTHSLALPLGILNQ